MKHAPSWNKLVEHFHGDEDVVFGDVTLWKNHFRQVCSVNLEPGNGSWPTTVTSTKVQDATAAHTRRRPARPCATNSVQDGVHAAVRQGTGRHTSLQREQGGERHCNAR